MPPSSIPQVQPSNALEPEFPRKSQSLLKRWREKVFALMVQLKAQELEHGACVQQLKGQVAWCSSFPRSFPQLALYIRGGIYLTSITEWLSHAGNSPEQTHNLGPGADTMDRQTGNVK